MWLSPRRAVIRTRGHVDSYVEQPSPWLRVWALIASGWADSQPSAGAPLSGGVDDADWANWAASDHGSARICWNRLACAQCRRPGGRQFGLAESPEAERHIGSFANVVGIVVAVESRCFDSGRQWMETVESERLWGSQDTTLNLLAPCPPSRPSLS